MNRLKIIAVSLLAVLAVATAASAKYKPTVKADVGIYPNDFGATTIDVSHYPPKMKLYYKVFSQKCQACHTIARPINSQFLELTADEIAAAKKTQPEIFKVGFGKTRRNGFGFTGALNTQFGKTRNCRLRLRANFFRQNFPVCANFVNPRLSRRNLNRDNFFWR